MRLPTRRTCCHHARAHLRKALQLSGRFAPRTPACLARSLDHCSYSPDHMYEWTLCHHIHWSTPIRGIDLLRISLYTVQYIGTTENQTCLPPVDLDFNNFLDWALDLFYKILFLHGVVLSCLSGTKIVKRDCVVFLKLFWFRIILYLPMVTWDVYDTWARGWWAQLEPSVQIVFVMSAREYFAGVCKRLSWCGWCEEWQWNDDDSCYLKWHFTVHLPLAVLKCLAVKRRLKEYWAEMCILSPLLLIVNLAHVSVYNSSGELEVLLLATRIPPAMWGHMKK